MDNKVFGMTFISILASALLFFGVANAGAAAVDKWLFPSKKFGEHTYIGTTNVSNMEVASAMAQFSGMADTWRESAELLVTYQDATVEYPLDKAEILLEETAVQAQTGVQNSFVYQLDDEATALFLEKSFPVAKFSAAEVEKVTTRLEQALESGSAQTHATISDDSLDIGREVVSDVVFPIHSSSGNLADIVEAINDVQIGPGAKFSFLDFIGELKLVEATDAELTEIASAIYTAVLQTNFTVDERSIGTSVPNAVPVGQEAAINRTLGVDLVFTNPNASSFTLDTAIVGNSLTASLTGFPFVHDYSIQTSGKETVKPRLIKQYSAFVTNGKAVEEEGSEGVRIQVLRSIMSEGKELKVETISTDFYPPVNRVEVYPLQAAPVESAPAASGAEENPSSDSTTDTPESQNENTETDSTDSSNSPINENPTDDENSDPPSDPDNTTDPTEPVYDKGGNLVNP